MQRFHTVTKVLLAGSAALCAWTLSIQLIPLPLKVTEPGHVRCQPQEYSAVIDQHLANGVLTRMYQDAEALEIEISQIWQTLNQDSRTTLYTSLACLAQQEEVTLRIVPSRE